MENCLFECDLYKTGFMTNDSGLIRKIKRVESVAKTDIPILITGPTGTGKKPVAYWFHKQSGRNDFVTFNSAESDTLVESRLFGHERGAFTGAERKRDGLFSIADGGTLVLDEIGNMPQLTQEKILMAVEEKKFRPLGARQEITVDTRVIAISNVPLEKLIEEGKFRKDLYYRLNVARLHIPSLEERREDIPLLLDFFFNRAQKEFGKDGIFFSSEAIKFLVFQYDWPGNVRQMENIIRFLIASASMNNGGREITARDVEDVVFSGNGHRISDYPGKTDKRDEILFFLRKNDWNKVETASNMGVAVDTVHRWVKKFGLALEEEREKLDKVRSALESTGWNIDMAAQELGIGSRALQNRMKKYGIAREGKA